MFGKSTEKSDDKMLDLAGKSTEKSDDKMLDLDDLVVLNGFVLNAHTNPL